MPKPFSYNIYKMFKKYGNKLLNKKKEIRALCSD
uniref:Uncharacterized protein n=1 Tax=viral metagenome TaxID=1070528 RepID=A0A6C0EY82_9ZZZZ